jgi:pimeloyl-ACP methyl ester carboxylesterase
VSDLTGPGPYQSQTTKAMGPSTSFTIYYPEPLAPDGAKNPIVGWMSGGGTDHSFYPLLPLLATHGFVVVAPDVIPGIGEESNLGKQIIEGIEWAIAENAREGSMFFQKLDTSKLASAGYSMGSLATFQIAADERLTTTVHISGGNMAPDAIHNLREPAIFLCGIASPDCADLLSSTCDIAAANCDTDFAAATTPVFYGNFQSGHLGILTPPFQEQIQTEVVAWLRWQLMDDASIKARFVGESCGVCTDDRWKVQQKNLD